MKRTITLTVALALAWGVTMTGALGQKGTGDRTGIARQAVKPDIVSLSGRVSEVKTGPCETGTGRAEIGSHFLLVTADGETLNIHLGPKGAVDQIVDQLAVDQQTTVTAFRTEKMPEGAYVAQSLTFDDDQVIRLRDEDLRPVWARGRWSAGDGFALASGVARGAACCPGKGRCQGCAAACGQGQGKGQGRGAATGQGKGRGQGRGAGFGQGRGNGPGPRAGFNGN